MNFWPAFINNALLPLVAITFGFTVVAYFPDETLFWLADKTWLPYPLLTVTIIIASQFNQSRFFYASVLWMGVLLTLDNPHWIPLESVNISMLFPLIATAVLILSWQQDRGLRFSNILMNVVILGCAMSSVFFLMQWESLSNHPQYHSLSNTYFNSFTALSAQMTALEFLFYGLLIIALSARLIVSPTFANSLLATSLLLIIIIQITPNPQLIRFAASLFACAAVAIILLDSHRMAFKDELTGISSRRALTHYTKSLMKSYTVVMADVDHFKAFNDKYGHDVGDQVLRMVAQQLNQVSKGGKAFRYGGEEFTLVFPGKKPEQVFEAIDSLRESIADYPLVIRQPDRPKTKPKNKQEMPQSPPKQKVVHVTMSFGAALKDKNTPYEQALKKADQALYKAKNAGRNNVQMA